MGEHRIGEPTRIDPVEDEHPGHENSGVSEVQSTSAENT